MQQEKSLPIPLLMTLGKMKSDIRCIECGKLLFKYVANGIVQGELIIEIKCPYRKNKIRCGCMNQITCGIT